MQLVPLIYGMLDNEADRLHPEGDDAPCLWSDSATSPDPGTGPRWGLVLPSDAVDLCWGGGRSFEGVQGAYVLLSLQDNGTVQVWDAARTCRGFERRAASRLVDSRESWARRRVLPDAFHR